jgi:hypothetical protein
MAAQVHVGIGEVGSDDERLEEMALQLRAELLALEVESVQPAVAGEAPTDSRSALAAVAGALTVSLQPTMATIGGVVAVVREWLRRSGGQRTVRIEIDGDTLELGGASAEVQQKLVDDWIARHSVAAAES